MTTTELFEKLKEMPEAVAKIQAECKTPEEAYNALKELGLTDSFEEFKAKAKEVMITAAEMSFADVDAAAAGDDDVDDVYICIGTAITTALMGAV